MFLNRYYPFYPHAFKMLKACPDSIHIAFPCLNFGWKACGKVVAEGVEVVKDGCYTLCSSIDGTAMIAFIKLSL